MLPFLVLFKGRKQLEPRPFQSKQTFLTGIPDLFIWKSPPPPPPPKGTGPAHRTPAAWTSSRPAPACCCPWNAASSSSSTRSIAPRFAWESANPATGSDQYWNKKKKTPRGIAVGMARALRVVYRIYFLIVDKNQRENNLSVTKTN